MQRILLAKVGLDGHDDAGFEVIYLGLRQSPEAVARAAVAEDVDAVGLSVLSGAHVELTRKLSAALAEAGRPDVPLLVGGFIRPGEVESVREAGAAAVFPAGEPLTDVVANVREALARLAANDR